MKKLLLATLAVLAVGAPAAAKSAVLMVQLKNETVVEK